MISGSYQFLDDNALPLAGGKVYTYLAGTTTEQTTYTDDDLAAGHENTNPVILDSAGRALIFMTAVLHKFIVKTSADVTVLTIDPIADGLSYNSGGYLTDADVTFENLNTNGDVGTGASQVAFGNHTHSDLVTGGDAHDHSGGDGAAIVEAAITLADNTTNNASTSKHGFLKKLSNVSTEFMNGQGSWAEPAGAGGVTDHGALTGLGDDDHSAIYFDQTRGDARYALTAKGVTNGDTHNHDGGDGAQISHTGLSGLSNDEHTQYHNNTRGDLRYAPIAKGVTGGDAHDHSGGDGGQISHGALANLGVDDHTQYLNQTRGDARYTLTAHDHNGGDGNAIVEAAITLADNTTNDVSITKHGFVPKAPNDATKFLRGDATWAASGIKSVTRGVATVASGDAYTDVAISAVTLAKTFVTSSVRGSAYGGTAYLTSTINLRCQHISGLGTTDYIAYEIIEFY